MAGNWPKRVEIWYLRIKRRIESFYVRVIYKKMPAHIRKGLITGAPAFNSGGLGLSIGSRVGGIRAMISKRAPDGGKIAPVPEVTEYKIRGDDINNLTFNGTPPDQTTNKYVETMFVTTTDVVYTSSSFAENRISDLEFSIIVANGKTVKVNFKPGNETIVESLITKQSENVYIYTMPSISGTLITETNGAIAVLYLNGNALSATESAADDDVELQLSGIGYSDPFELDTFKTHVNDYVSGKVFTIKMTSDRTLTVKSDNLLEVPLTLPAPA